MLGAMRRVWPVHDILRMDLGLVGMLLGRHTGYAASQMYALMI